MLEVGVPGDFPSRFVAWPWPSVCVSCARGCNGTCADPSTASLPSVAAHVSATASPGAASARAARVTALTLLCENPFE